MPKIGMPSSTMIMVDWLDALKAAIENDFDAFEISCVFPSAEPDNIKPETLSEAKSIVADSEIEICVHAPFLEINIAAFYQSIREQSIRIIESSIDLCHELDGRVLITHSGNYTYNFPDATRHNHKALELQWNSNIEALKRINGYANDRGITVCLENTAIEDNHIDRCYTDLLEIRDAVGDSMRFTLDMGHARLSEGASEAIRTLGDAIGHIHLSDNFGEKDDHLSLGDGNYNYSEFADFLKNFDRIITLEVINIGADPAPVVRCREALAKLLE